jgi:hypothetical protein
MADLLAKRRASRETVVEAGGHKFTLRRPTAYERVSIGDTASFDLLCKFVVGWDLAVIDLVPGGDPAPAPFDAALLADYLADTPKLWEPLTGALLKSITDHDATLEATAKN